MEPMYPNPDDRDLVLAAPETVVSAEAREQTPTLMAGEAAGSQGAVQVWAADRRRLWSQALAWTLLIMLELLALFFSWRYSRDPIQVFQGGCYLLVIVIATAAAYVTLRWPCYLTTDDAGMGIRLAGGGTRVLRWRDVISIERKGSSLILLTPGDPGKVFLRLTGYPRPVRKAIEDLIIERAELVHNQFTRQVPYGSWKYPVEERKWVKAPTESKKLGSGDGAGLE